MAKKPSSKSTPAVASPAPAGKSTPPPKRLIATTRPPAGRVSKVSPAAKDVTPKAAPAPAPAAASTPAAVVAPPNPATAKPAARAAKPAKTAPAPAAVKPATKPIKLTSSRRKAPEPAVPRVVTHEEIAVRAYLIAEHRQNHGIWGEPHLDWIEAERQLKAELLP
jgi:hypothetical protein